MSECKCDIIVATVCYLHRSLSPPARKQPLHTLTERGRLWHTGRPKAAMAEDMRRDCLQGALVAHFALGGPSDPVRALPFAVTAAATGAVVLANDLCLLSCSSPRVFSLSL